MALKHVFTKPDAEKRTEAELALEEEIRACLDGEEKELKELVRDLVDAFFDLTEIFYEELDQLDERIVAIENKYNLNEFDDEDSRGEQET